MQGLSHVYSNVLALLRNIESTMLILTATKRLSVARPVSTVLDAPVPATCCAGWFSRSQSAPKISSSAAARREVVKRARCNWSLVYTPCADRIPLRMLWHWCHRTHLNRFPGFEVEVEVTSCKSMLLIRLMRWVGAWMILGFWECSQPLNKSTENFGHNDAKNINVVPWSHYIFFIIYSNFVIFPAFLNASKFLILLFYIKYLAVLRPFGFIHEVSCAILGWDKGRIKQRPKPLNSAAMAPEHCV
jgi:hypothetical protein